MEVFIVSREPFVYAAISIITVYKTTMPQDVTNDNVADFKIDAVCPLATRRGGVAGLMIDASCPACPLASPVPVANIVITKILFLTRSRQFEI